MDVFLKATATMPWGIETMPNTKTATKTLPLNSNLMQIAENDGNGYRSTITRVIVTTPATISTHTSSHVINTISNTGTLRVRLTTTER